MCIDRHSTISEEFFRSTETSFEGSSEKKKYVLIKCGFEGGFSKVAGVRFAGAHMDYVS